MTSEDVAYQNYVHFCHLLLQEPAEKDAWRLNQARVFGGGSYAMVEPTEHKDGDKGKRNPMRGIGHAGNF